MLIKFALKTAIATALLGAIFQGSSLIEHLAYPVMGLILTIQPSLGPTVKKGWGRLGGSVIGGLIGAWVVLTVGSGPITSGLAFVFATLVCELFRFEAAYSQAGVVSALIAAQVMGGANPAQYVLSRVSENWIGIILGIVITTVFWPDNPSKTLADNLTRILSNSQQLVQLMVAGDRSGNPSSSSKQQLMNDLGRSIQRSKTVLSQEIYGIVGSHLAQGNWSSLLASGDRMQRHLSMMLKLLDSEPRTLSWQFAEPLQQIADRISHSCAALTEIAQFTDSTHSGLLRLRIFTPAPKLLADPQIPLVKEALQSLVDQLGKTRSDGSLYEYPIADIRHFYQFLHHLDRFVQALEQMTIALINREKSIGQPDLGVRLTWHPVPPNRVFHILKTGFAIWLTLTLLNDWLKLPFNYYAIFSIIIAMQPTFGKTTVAGSQRVIVTGIGAVYTLGLINTIGSTPLTLAIGIALIILTSSYLGFAQGAATGCVLMALSILTHTSDPNNYIWHRFLETAVGTVIALILNQLFWPDTSSQQLDRGISQTFKTMGRLYANLIESYLQNTALEPESTQLRDQIRQALKNHAALQKETQQEHVYNMVAPKVERRWNLLLNYEKELLKDLELLQDAVKQDRNTEMPPELQAAIRSVAEATLLSFNQLAKATGPQSNRQTNQQQVNSPLSAFDLIDQVMFNLRTTGVMLSYSLDQVLSLTAVVAVIRDTAGNLDQVASDLKMLC